MDQGCCKYKDTLIINNHISDKIFNKITFFNNEIRHISTLW